MNENRTGLDFIIGAEKRITEIISRAEIEPLLRSLVKAGPLYAMVLDEDNLLLSRQGLDDNQRRAGAEIRHKLLVEGEPKGTLVVACSADSASQYESLAFLARDALQLIINNNLKRMLTTEVHTSVVHESYEQLVEANKLLAESEKAYRQLALSLEKRVDDRTLELKKAYARMLQQEKLAAVGSLAAGMAHEINNPNGFVRSNLVTFSRYFHKVQEMVDFYRFKIANGTPLQQLQEEAEKKYQNLKLGFVCADTAELLTQSIDGSDRIARIVADLKSFSHVDETGDSDADLNAELDRTLSIVAPQFPPGTVITRDFKPLPLYGCNPGLLSQAFFNIIQNAIQSRDTALNVTISSMCEDNTIIIRITDNGCGISAHNLTRIFEPFFTTHDVGHGTGMGLSVAREIITGSGGSIEVDSEEGSGTVVTVRLPLEAGKG